MVSHNKWEKLTYKKMSREFTAIYSLLRRGETLSYILGIGKLAIQHWGDAEDQAVRYLLSDLCLLCFSTGLSYQQDLSVAEIQKYHCCPSRLLSTFKEHTAFPLQGFIGELPH